jgi:putative peptidoglycan lipid II flippase
MNRRRIAQAAVIIMLGNLVTSGLGFVRQAVTAIYFPGSNSDAWFAAYTVPQMFYDLVIGGAIAAALIPTFTRLAESDRERFWRVVTTIAVIAAGVIAVLIGILELGATPLMTLIASGFHHKRLDLAVKLVRVILPTLLFWGLSAISLAALYSLGKRVAASFATACFHLGIIVGAVLLGHYMGLGLVALPIGAVCGSAAQFTVQVPSLWRSRRAITGWVGRHVDFREPAVRQILKLYGPVALGILASMAGQIADLEFKSHLHTTGWYSDMQYATTLIQFPVGIVVAALGLAVLPMISSDVAAHRMAEFKQKLGLGFRVVLVLMVPAAVGLMLIGHPIAQLVFQHGHLHAGQADQISRALVGYGAQLPFIGIDQLLIFAFYARHNTVTPMLVGVAGVCVYVASAFLLFPLQVFGLALANTIQIVFHAVVLFILLTRVVGWIEARETWMAAIKVAGSATVMAGGILLTNLLVQHIDLGRTTTLVAVVAPMAVAIVLYGVCLHFARLEELRDLRRELMGRLRPGGDAPLPPPVSRGQV